MRCCGREVTAFELQVSSQPFVLYRCSVCQSSRWVREDEHVDVVELTEALRGETRQRQGRKAPGNP